MTMLPCEKWLRGAEIVLECLKKEGVDTIFGYPGGAVIPLYDALYDYRNTFKHILTAHEQGAVHAADGYARSTGRVGVCFVTSGPGATNTVTGIATAYADSSPLVVITGNVPRSLLGKDSFQEVDITGITIPITKHNYLVESAEELAETISHAFATARSGRPGPVLIDIPKDLFTQWVTYRSPDNGCTDSDRTEPDHLLIARAAHMIARAKRPLFMTGGGTAIAGAHEKLIELAERCAIPVVSTLMGLGVCPSDNPLFLGMAGMHGSKQANHALCISDLIIAVGTRFSDRVAGKASHFAASSRLIQIDLDETENSKNLPNTLFIKGDARTVLTRLGRYLPPAQRCSWLQEVREKEFSQYAYYPFHPAAIIRTINRLLPENALVVTDVGQHQMWTAQFWRFTAPRTFLTSGGMGTMGFGLGAAIGAAVGNPGRAVVLITGDGSFRMNMHELATVRKYRLPILIVMLSNGSLGMVRQWQGMFQNGRYSETDLGDEIDHIKLLDAFGIAAYRLTDTESITAILSAKGALEAPLFIECPVDKDMYVYPIVPPGEGLEQMILNTFSKGDV